MKTERSGFTLVEILIASMIGAFVLIVGFSAMRTISSAAITVENNFDANAELRFVSGRIQADLANIYRDTSPMSMKLVGRLEDIGDEPICILTFYTTSRVKARAEEPEGEVYEVEYFMRRNEDESFLMRRVWPNPDREQKEPGGILSVVAENAAAFIVRYYDGENWQVKWPEEIPAFPELVEVTIALKIEGTDELTMETFVAKLPEVQVSEGQMPGGQGPNQGPNSGNEVNMR